MRCCRQCVMAPWSPESLAAPLPWWPIAEMCVNRSTTLDEPLGARVVLHTICTMKQTKWGTAEWICWLEQRWMLIKSQAGHQCECSPEDGEAYQCRAQADTISLWCYSPLNAPWGPEYVTFLHYFCPSFPFLHIMLSRCVRFPPPRQRGSCWLV